VRLGEVEFSCATSAEGRFSLRVQDGLLAVAGTARLSVEHGETRLVLSLRVHPTRLADEALFALLDALEELAPGLAGDLGGRAGLHSVETSPAEAILRLLERIEGPLVAAAAQVAAKPIARHRVQWRPVALDRPSRSPAALTWIARHPAAVAPVRARGLHAGALREEELDLETPENRGVLALFRQCDRIAASLEEVLDDEQARLLRARPEREAFLTSSGSLFSERDLPRLKAIARRQERVRAMRLNLGRAGRRLGFPFGLRPAPLARSARLERHRGYWALFEAWREVRDVLPLRPRPAFLPLRNTDELYELWSTLAFLQVLGEVLERPLLPELEIQEGWFAELPTDLLVEVTVGETELRVHREPAYRWGGDDPVQKLVAGRPWRPDLVLEVRRGGWPISLHVFDAKHSLSTRGRGGAPWELFEKVWLKYVDTIGLGDGTPLVDSCWILFPGRVDRAVLKSPSMLWPTWPTERPRGGALPLTPLGTTDALRTVLEAILAVSLG